MAPASRIANSPNTIRILISSDNHVGYNERDPIRGDDSWKTFHEVMVLAKEQDVDMVLLAGDLFHENKPSRKAMYQVLKTLRATCYGDKPCELELLSEAELALRDAFGHINYEDPDINVAIPVLAISGNHDDASGDGNLAALDILSVTGLVNHFGRVPENDNITLTPLLFRKGYTNMALYGMANVRDERLHRTFRDHKVKFLRPESEEEGSDKWFSIMALHQNHHAHSETGYLPENFLPRFLDLVIWGHEHECIMGPQHNPEQGFDVIQPGSSVVTSLCEGEAVEKFVGLLSIEGSKYELETIKLKTVRPFVMKEVILARDCGFVASSKNKGQVIRWLIQQVTELIEQANEQWIQANSEVSGQLLTDEDPPLPLIRLRVEYSGGYEVENPRRFSNRFVGKVANVNDVVQFYRKKSGTTRRTNAVGEAIDVIDAVDLDHIKVQSLVEEFLKQQTLDVLPAAGMNDAISQYVDKDDKQAIKTFVDETLEKQMKRLMSLGDVGEEELEHVMASANQGQQSSEKEVPSKRQHSQVASANKRSKGAASRGRSAKVTVSDEDDSSVDEDGPTRRAPSKRVQPARNVRMPADASLFVGGEDDESIDEEDDVMLEDSSDVEYDRKKTKTPQTRASKSQSTRASQPAPTPISSNARATTRKTPASRGPAASSQTTGQRGSRSAPKTVQAKLSFTGSSSQRNASSASAAANRQSSTSTSRMAPMDIVEVEDDSDDGFA
ncbi:Mre11 DNA-binding presumed domain-containing protein [Lipomyces starkeyi]|uniref:Double-strand break repair protein n=1 Tax=Lipomyces starkeyi NRRL Y-11557 TaxID=675824 RepID=A0A1E3Q2U1_LIPST|nr:hypothetical protein LIPSTDRAFT_72679 [Lipomyces starkeyi NRRL Y-11557]